MPLRWFLIVCCALPSVLRAEPLELREGDRVVLIGGTFIEREQNYAYLETFLRARWPERSIIFRNVGWSGDTVFGESRAVYDGVKGLDRLDEVVREIKPTVLFISYGHVESFDGAAGLSRFREGLVALLNRLSKDFNPRVVLIGPTRHENLGPPWPDPSEHNRSLRAYADAVADVAREHGHRFIDLYAFLDHGGGADSPLTENGIHLTQYGYWRAARAIATGLGLGEPAATNGRVVPVCPSPLQPRRGDRASRAGESMRELAILKNIQFFNQWRPANEPYIFGFRKAEQSRNRVEIPRFTQSIERLEAEIAALAQPIDITYELRPLP